MQNHVGVFPTDDQLLKKISEVKYLSTDNTWRYRVIMRYFYEQQRRYRSNMSPREVYSHLKEVEYFKDYTEEELSSDLQQLTQWGNLVATQEVTLYQTIEDFKRKNFRYQCTAYAVEIEELIVKLEGMEHTEGGSLERTLVIRLLDKLRELTDHGYKSDARIGEGEGLNQLWNELFSYFKELIAHTANYLAYIESNKLDQMLQKEAFIIYKNALTDQLKNFIIVLQDYAPKIKAVLKDMEFELINKRLEMIVDYLSNNPLQQLGKEELTDQYLSQWLSLKEWFLGSNNDISQLTILQQSTEKAISQITRTAQQLSEKYGNSRNQYRDYLKLSEWFNDMEDMAEAHKLFAYTFGVLHTRHLFAGVKATEDIEAHIWELPPTVINLQPRIRNSQKTIRTNMKSKTKDKMEIMQEYIQRKEEERQIIETLVNGNSITLSDLIEVEPIVRKSILNWIGRSMGSGKYHNNVWIGKTEYGQKFKLYRKNDKTIIIDSEDGRLKMPNFEIEFMR